MAPVPPSSARHHLPACYGGPGGGQRCRVPGPPSRTPPRQGRAAPRGSGATRPAEARQKSPRKRPGTLAAALFPPIARPSPGPATSGRQGGKAPLPSLARAEHNRAQRHSAHAHTDCLAPHACLVSTASAPTAQARSLRPYSATAHPCSPRLSGGKMLEGVLAKPPRHDALPFRVLRSAPPAPLSCAHAPRALFPWQLRLFSAKPPARSWGGGARREGETTGGGRQGTRRLPAAPPRKRTGST